MIPTPNYYEHPDPDDPLYDPEDDDANHAFTAYTFDPFNRGAYDDEP